MRFTRYGGYRIKVRWQALFYFYTSYISCCNSIRMVKIGVRLRKLSQKPGFRFFGTLCRCTAMHSLMAARWAGHNSGPIFRRLWTKVKRIKSACAGVSVVCNAVFRLTTSCCVPEIFAIKSRSSQWSFRKIGTMGTLGPKDRSSRGWGS